MKKFLSMPREGATIVPIEDIGKVEQESDSSEFEIVNCLQNVQIVGVPQLHSYNACLQVRQGWSLSHHPLEDAPNLTVA